MDHERLIKDLREICRAPEPERKEIFFQGLAERGLTSGRPTSISHGEFILRQFLYIGKMGVAVIGSPVIVHYMDLLWQQRKLSLCLNVSSGCVDPCGDRKVL